MIHRIRLYSLASFIVWVASAIDYPNWVQAQESSEFAGKSLLGGRYITTSDVTDILKLEADIFALGSTNNPDTAELIYRQGGTLQNSPLSSLSLNADNQLKNDPTFILFRNYFQNVVSYDDEFDGFLPGDEAGTYGDFIVSELFNRNATNVAGETILVLHVWMTIIHELQGVIRQCETEQNAQESLRSLDRAAAYWISAQKGGESTSVVSTLYGLAEASSTNFNDDLGESWLNTELLQRLNSLSAKLSQDGYCSDVSKKSIIRTEAQRTMDLMNVPLIQQWIHFVASGEDAERTVVYRAAALPHIYACDEGLARDIGLDTKSMTSNQKKAWTAKLIESLSCFRLTCEEIGTYQNQPELLECPDRRITLIAEYEAFDPIARSYARIDRDLVRMGVFMKQQAYEAALDLYQYGHHATFSLQSLSMNTVIPKTERSFFDLYRNYHNRENYDFIDYDIKAMLSATGEFASLSNGQLSDMVLGTLRFESILLSLLSAFQVAEASCWIDTQESIRMSRQYWDMGAALYVGSIDSRSLRGQGDGQMFFETSKALCRQFDTCFGANSRSNNLMMQILVEGRDFIANKKCDQLSSLVEDNVFGTLQTVLLQGTITSAAMAADEESTADRGLGTLHAFARSILPLVNKASDDSAVVLKRNLLFNPNQEPLVDGIFVVIDALSQALANMKAKCADIGTLKSLDIKLCDSAFDQHPANLITFGRYKFSEPETAYSVSSITLDLKDMASAASVQEGVQIYTEGRNAQHAGNTVIPQTIAAFSTEGTSMMSRDPLFNIYLYALYGGNGIAETSTDSAYSNEFVEKTLRDGDLALASEASVVLNLWMMIIHQLSTAVETCKNRESPQLRIDAAVALWVGRNQTEASAEDGWSMYSISQQASLSFGPLDGETPVNSGIMNAFLAMQEAGENCEGDELAFLQLRPLVHDIIRLLSTPLVQKLLISITSRDEQRVQLYSLALIPQCVACDPSVHSKLSDRIRSNLQELHSDSEFIDSMSSFLSCMQITCQDIRISASGVSPPILEDLVSDLCEGLKAAPTDMIQQQSISNNTEDIYDNNALLVDLTRIDLDILRVFILVKMKAYDSALDCYMYGVHVRKENWIQEEMPNGLLSLHGLALLHSQQPNPSSKVFEEYFGSNTYADDVVRSSFNQDDIFMSTSVALPANGLLGILQGTVLYQSTSWHLYEAVEACKKEQISSSIDFLTAGYALFSGSMSPSPDSAIPSFSLRSLGNKLCEAFDSCSNDGNSISNEIFFSMFDQLRDSLLDLECDTMEDLVFSEVLPLIRVPLVQGAIGAVLFGEDKDLHLSVPSGYFFSKAVLPEVEAANSQSAKEISSVYSSPFKQRSSLEEAMIVVDAFKYSLGKLNIDCTLVGRIKQMPSIALCHDYGVSSFTSPVISDLGLQVSAMRYALELDDEELARRVYEEGDPNATSTELLTLQQLSTVATFEMLDDPLFNYFLVELRSASMRNSDEDDYKYADSFVEMILTRPSASPETLASEAVVALHLWMYVSHLLHKAVVKCAGAESVNDLTSIVDMAVSYWVGDADINVEGQPGHLLFSMANDMDQYFESKTENTLSVNEHILTLFAEARHHVTAPGACSVGSNSTYNLQRTVHDITEQMTIPLVQGTLHALKTNDRDRVQLYGRAITPLFATCHPNDYTYMHENLFEAAYYSKDVEKVISRIYSTLSCLGLRCDQIGTHISENQDSTLPSRCEIPDYSNTIAGYQPVESLAFEEVMRLDQDLRAMEILMDIEAFGAAVFVFQYGMHSNTSLERISTRNVVDEPQFEDSFVAFYGILPYASEMTMETLFGANRPLTGRGRQKTVLRYSQMVILQHAALLGIYDSLTTCEEGIEHSHNEMVMLWDKSAAMLLGSMDYEELLSDTDITWYAPYALSQEYCSRFETCSSTGESKTNKALVKLLLTGRGAAASANCDGIRGAFESMQPLLLVPIMQSLIASSLDMSNPNTRNEDVMSTGVAASRALLPLINDIDSKLAAQLEELYPVPAKLEAFGSETGAEVLSLLGHVYDKLNVECELLGTADGLNPCAFAIQDNDTEQVENNKGPSAGRIILYILLVFLLVGAVVGYFLWRRRRQGKGKLVLGGCNEPDLNEGEDFLDLTFEEEFKPPSSSTLSSSGHPTGRGAQNTRTSLMKSSSYSSSDQGEAFSTMTSITADTGRITKSFRKSRTIKLSHKADRALSRIAKYGDDESVVVPSEATPTMPHKKGRVGKGGETSSSDNSETRLQNMTAGSIV